MVELSKGDIPDIFWDGILPLTQMILGQPGEERLVLGDNGEASFMAIKPLYYMIGLPDPVDRNYQNFKGKIVPLKEVVIRREDI